MWKTKLGYIFMGTFMFFSIFSLIQNNIFLTRTVTSYVFAHTYSLDEEEWWIEVEITPKDGEQEVNDEILLSIYDEFLS